MLLLAFWPTVTRRSDVWDISVEGNITVVRCCNTLMTNDDTSSRSGVVTRFRCPTGGHIALEFGKCRYQGFNAQAGAARNITHDSNVGTTGDRMVTRVVIVQYLSADARGVKSVNRHACRGVDRSLPSTNGLTRSPKPPAPEGGPATDGGQFDDGCPPVWF
jgi:hypothetical protein